jgi:hypothetical protein
MLAFLAGRATDRQLRLFACACVRHLGNLLSPHEESILRVAEEAAEGRADPGAVRRLEAAARPASGRGPVWFAEVLLLPDAIRLAWLAAQRVRRLRMAAIPHEAIRLKAPKNLLGLAGWRAKWDEVEESIAAANRAEAVWPSAALRDIVGNPFRPAPAVDPGVLSWHGGTVPRLAQAISAERAFDRMPVLADALEDAGCADPELLGHLRGPGPHARGCWAVDLLLGNG